jgi:hypothetical protein
MLIRRSSTNHEDASNEGERPDDKHGDAVRIVLEKDRLIASDSIPITTQDTSVRFEGTTNDVQTVMLKQTRGTYSLSMV